MVHDQVPSGKVWPARSIIHLYNLNVQRLSSFDDKVTPATNIKIALLAPFQKIKTVRLDSADPAAAAGKLPFTEEEVDGKNVVTFTVPRWT